MIYLIAFCTLLLVGCLIGRLFFIERKSYNQVMMRMQARHIREMESTLKDRDKRINEAMKFHLDLMNMVKDIK